MFTNPHRRGAAAAPPRRPPPQPAPESLAALALKSLLSMMATVPSKGLAMAGRRLDEEGS
jgi:hypothetical protein